MAVDKEYSDLVSKGKALLVELKEHKEKMECFQAKIAKWALTVCDIRHGGRSNGIYTVKRYAEDIGAHHGSVLQWTRIYKTILMKIGIEDPTREEWARANRADRVMKNERSFINKKNGKEGTRTCYVGDVPKNRVVEIFNEIEEKPFISELEALIISAKRIKFIVGTKDLNIIQDIRLTELMEILDHTSDQINDHLTEKSNIIKKKARLDNFLNVAQ